MKTENRTLNTEHCQRNTEHCQPKILVAPLNWGIGHATRCIPIINELLKKGFVPIIASDGDALILLQKEFPNVVSYKLPTYNIQYAKKKLFFKLKLLFQTPKIIKQIKAEHHIVKDIIKKENIIGIISDNRFGVYNKEIPSVYITHQVQVLSGFLTYFTTTIHNKIINKFDACWLPDTNIDIKLSGKLSNTKNLKTKVNYLGILSRFNFSALPNVKNQNILVLLSGNEPQRTLLENKLIRELKKSTKKIVFVRGIISDKGKMANTKNITFKNYLLKNALEKVIRESEIIISRSGYSTIMDLAVLQKKAFFIPTPGQTEQEYLAKHLDSLKIAPFCKQKSFTLSKLNVLKNYTGFDSRFKNNLSFPFKIFTTVVK